MAGKSRLEWHGDTVKKKMRRAQKAGVQKTGKELVDEAKKRVAERSGDLKGSIKEQQEEPYETEVGYSMEVGSDEPGEIGYAAIQELGPKVKREYKFTPYMKPALDIIRETKVMQKAIREDFEKG
jgi:hypothetical protein